MINYLNEFFYKITCLIFFGKMFAEKIKSIEKTVKIKKVRYMLFKKTILMVEFLNMLYNDLFIDATISKNILYTKMYANTVCAGGNQ